MQHKCKVTVLRKELFSDLQKQYLADPASGACPFYEEGQEFVFKRYASRDDFWTMGKGTQCSEAWDAISRYIYTALQGGAIMRNWTNDERVMIACCNDGTRPVVFKIERIDYKAVYLKDAISPQEEQKIDALLKTERAVKNVVFNREEGFIEAELEQDVDDNVLRAAVQQSGEYQVTKIE